MALFAQNRTTNQKKAIGFTKEGVLRSIPVMILLTLAGCAASRPTLTTEQLLYASENRPQTAKLRAIWDATEIVTQNIGNADTIGYKRRTARQGHDGKLAIAFDMEQGSLESTGRQFDLGISGPGFFRVKDAIGVYYTRNGNLFVNKDGLLVLGLGDGLPLDPPVAIPLNTAEVRVSQDGTVSVVVFDKLQHVGTIALWSFERPEQLSTSGRGPGLFEASDHSGVAVERKPGEGGQLLQGFLEKSNVDLEHERRRLKFLEDWKAAVEGRRN